MVASSLDNITVAELTKAASAAVHKGDVMNSGAWNFKARIAVKRISPVVLEIFDGAERPTDTDAAALYDKANSLLSDFLGLCVDEETEQGALLMDKVMALSVTPLKDDGAALLKVMRGEDMVMSDAEATALESDIKKVKISLDATLVDVQMAAKTIKDVLERMPIERRGQPGRAAELLMGAVPKIA